MNIPSKTIDWVETLKNYVAKNPGRTPQEIDDETDRKFIEYIEEEKKFQAKQDPSLNKIPKFFQKAITNENQLNFKVRQEARTRFLHHKTSEILDKEG
jgi:serine/threonine-protein phosphatase 2A regulatory subunit B''